MGFTIQMPRLRNPSWFFTHHKKTLCLRSRGGGTEPENTWIPEIRKNYEKNTKSPTSGRPPKIRKNYRKNTKKAMFRPFLSFFGNFFVFSGGDLGWGILYFFRNFFVFLGFRGFRALYHPRGIVTLCVSKQHIWLSVFDLNVYNIQMVCL